MKEQMGSVNMNMDYLKEFEDMNVTSKNVFDLGDSGLLIILKDGTNLSKWDDVKDKRDVLYISEDLSKAESYSKYKDCTNAKVIVMQNFTDCSQLSPYVKGDLKHAFSKLDSLVAFYAINWDTSNETTLTNFFIRDYYLEYVYLEDWDTSNVESFWGMFAECCNLKTVEGIENWDLSSARNMESMFESCLSLEDISFLSNWDMSNVENVFEMFRDCYSLNDASCLNWKFCNLKRGDNLFMNCFELDFRPNWYDWDFTTRYSIRLALGRMDDKSIYSKIMANEFNNQDLFVAVEYIRDENLLKDIINCPSVSFYAKRAALLNPFLKDVEILEDAALNNWGSVERSYAIENPNLTNVPLLRDIAEYDESYLVRLKAKRRLKQLCIFRKDYAKEFMDLYETIEYYLEHYDGPYEFKELKETLYYYNKLTGILLDWKKYYPDDSNMELASVIAGYLVDDYDVELIRKTFLNAMPSLAENQVLFGWFVAKAVSLMK